MSSGRIFFVFQLINVNNASLYYIMIDFLIICLVSNLPICFFDQSFHSQTINFKL